MQNTIKKIIILLVILYSFPAILFSQWFALNTGTNRNFRGVFFTDQNIGYITGDTTLKTTDGGGTWSFLPVRYSQAIFFNNSLTGFVSARNNNYWGISKTTDGGLNWLYQNAYNNYPVRNICFINDLTGWYANGVQFSGYIFKTTNAGLNWFQCLFADAQLACRFYNADVGYSIGYYVPIRKSTDGGSNWITKTPPTGGIYGSLWLTDTNVIYMGSATGSIARSTDGANSWTIYSTGTDNVMFSIYFVNILTGYAAGGKPGSQIILKTTNAGTNWYVQQGVPPYELLSVHFINPNTGWAVGDSGRVIKTTNGGILGVEHQTNEMPEKFNLYQNYPNPFNPSTTICYDLPQDRFVKLTVLDVLGRTEKILVNEKQKAGKYEVNFEGNEYASGIYFYTLVTESFTGTGKMILIK